ncbi:MAG: DUF3108 domain-containing protein [Thermoanaerobaculia bacterium]|nr:DUF3108 domain-containing protein [Thermoanaerobaculia bacterium]
MGGTLARVFVPGRGEGRLITEPVGPGERRTVLKITSQDADGEEYWLWGSRLDAATLDAREAWNESYYRQREKRRETTLDEPGVIDIPSGIHLLRRRPPTEPLELELWTDGKIYPVLIEPGRKEQRQVDGRTTIVDHFVIEGRDVPDRRVWKGRLDVWLTPDEAAVPVEIVYRRKGGKVHLDLVPPE